MLPRAQYREELRHAHPQVAVHAVRLHVAKAARQGHTHTGNARRALVRGSESGGEAATNATTLFWVGSAGGGSLVEA